MLKEYKLSAYQDYGPLGSKEHIHLVRSKITGKVCIKKIVGKEQCEIIDFRRMHSSVYFPQILEVVKGEEQVIIIEEYIEGINLEEYMMGEALPEDEAVKIAKQICEALRLLHGTSPMIIYRDLKAENVMLTAEGNVKLVDFDISRKYQSGKKRDTELLGTAEYAAPEQFGYFQTDNRTDIYAFGVLFNYMLTGKFPVEYVTEGVYEGVVRKCIELEPGKRFQCVEGILEIFPEEIFEETNEDEITEGVIDSERAGNVENIEKQERSWIIPGFRTGKLWKMAAAVLGYGFILWMGTTIEFLDQNGVIYPAGKLWMNRIMYTVAQFATVFFSFDYRGIQKKIPFLEKIPLVERFPIGFRLLLFAVSWFAFVIMGVLAVVIIEAVFRI